MRRRVLACLTIVLMVLSSTTSIFVLNSSATTSGSSVAASSQLATSPSTSPNSGTTYGIGLSGAPVYMDVSTLQQLGGKPYSKATMELNVTRYLVPLAVHLVFLDPGWGNAANTSTTLVGGGFSQPIADWLSLGVQYQISTIFFFKQFGYYFASPSWDVDFMNQFPNSVTADSNGVNVPFPNGCAGCSGSSGWTIADSSDLYTQLKVDLTQYYKWYGNYSSWIGIGEGATGDRNQYAGSGTTIKAERPWDNGTIYAFAHSVYFQRSINSSGYYLGTNVLSEVWSEFLAEGPQQTYSVGYGFGSNPSRSIYLGTSSTVTFAVPVGSFYKGFTLKAWLEKSGSPSSSLTETLLANYSGGNHYTSLETETVSASSIGISSSWVSQTFTSTLIPSMHYEMTFSSSTSSAYEYATIANAIWVQSLTGGNITIEPVITENNANWHAEPSNPVYFEVPDSMTVNYVSWVMSDRSYDPNNITLGLVNTVTGKELATGTISIRQWGEPTQLSNIVTLQPDIKYEFNFSALPSNDYYGPSPGILQDFIASNVDPPYVGQTTIPTFTLGYGDFSSVQSSASNPVYISETDLQASPGYNGNTEVALRFTAPGTGTLNKFEVEVIHADDISGASLTGSLYSNGENHYPGTLMTSGSILLSRINSTFEAGACHTGTCTWANITFTGASLTGGSYYWIVLTSPASEVVLERLVNPTQFWVLTSTNGGSSWGTPLDGPTEFSFQIQTSAGDTNNTAIGQAQYEFDMGAFAQSFETTTAFQLLGVDPQMLSNGGSEFNMTGCVETDIGSDSPSGHVLACGVNLQNGISTGFGKGYGWGLNHPVNLTANTKYWLVFNVQCLPGFQCSSPARMLIDIYRSDAVSYLSFGGLHYEIQNGASWENQPYGLGNTRFELIGSNVTMKTYNTGTLYNEIKAYDDQSTGSSSGWNSFLQYEETSLMYNLSIAMTGLSGRQFYWYEGVTAVWGNIVPNYNYILSGSSGVGGPIGCDVTSPSCGGQSGYFNGELSDYLSGKVSAGNQSNWLLWASLGQTQDNGGTLSQSGYLAKYLKVVPPSAQSILTFDDWINSVQFGGILNMTQDHYPIQFGQMLSRMVYNGGWFGTSKGAVKALWVTEPSNDGAFPAYLEPAVQVTTITDANMTGINLKHYNVVINSTDLTVSAYSRLESFVSGGGGYVTVAMGENANNQNPILGLSSSPTSASTTSTFTITPSPITKPYTSISYTPYWLRYTISAISGSNPIVWVHDSNGNPIVASNNYGNGIGVLVQQPAGAGNTPGRLYSLTAGDSYVTLLINAAYYAAHKSSMLPIIWENLYGSGSASQAALQYFSVDGSLGTPLFWASNYASSKQTFDVHLNATFYGVATPWVAIDMQNMSVVASGATNDIHLHVTMQPFNWMPIYILSIPSNLSPVYHTASISSYSISNGTGTFILQGTPNQSSWLFVSSSSPVTSVSSNLTGSTPIQPSLSDLNQTKIGEYCTSVALTGGNKGACQSFTSYLQEGWYYDSTNKLLYVHFQGREHVEITVDTTYELQSSTSTVSTTASTETSESATNSPSGTITTTTSTTTASGYVTSSVAGTLTTSTTTSIAESSNSVNEPIYQLSLNPARGFVSQGGSARTVVQVNSNTVAERVRLLLGLLPPGVSADLQPSSGMHDFSASLTLRTTSAVVPGNYSLTVILVSTEGNYTVDYNLDVRALVSLPATIVVYVHDLYGIPVPNAMVTFNSADGLAQSQVTTGAGKAEFTSPKAGPYNLTVTYLGLSSFFEGDSAVASAVYVTLALSIPTTLTLACLAIVTVSAFALLRPRRRR